MLMKRWLMLSLYHFLFHCHNLLEANILAIRFVEVRLDHSGTLIYFGF